MGKETVGVCHGLLAVTSTCETTTSQISFPPVNPPDDA